MGNFISNFNTLAEYSAFTATTDCVKPHVSLVNEEGVAHFINDHDYVEIAGTKWATMNVGATKVEGQGYFFSWANPSGHCLNGNTDYDFGTSNDGVYKTTRGNTLQKNIPSNVIYDPATLYWGSDWRLPTTAETLALVNNTTSAWTSVNGVAGVRFTDNTDSSKSVFFPAAGYYYGTSHVSVGSYGYYWSSSLYSAAYAFNLYFGSTAVYPQNHNVRFLGFSARAVQNSSS